MLARSVELHGRSGCVECLEPIIGVAGGANRIQPVLLHQRVHRLRPAYLAEHDVSCGVVADNDHQRNQVFHREARTFIQAANHAGARALISVLERVAIGERELAFADLAKRLDHQRDFDDRHGVHLLLGVDGDFFVGIKALDVNGPMRIDAGCDLLDIGTQTGETGRRRGLLRLRSRLGERKG